MKQTTYLVIPVLKQVGAPLMVWHTFHLVALILGPLVFDFPLGRAPRIHQRLPTVHLIHTPSRGHLSLAKRNFSATPTNEIKETKYKALRIGNYLHVLLLTQILAAALLLGPPNVSRGVVVSNSLHPSQVS